MSETASRVSWEDPAAPFPANLSLTWWECLVAPTRFFERVDWEAPFARPLLYFLIVAILGGFVALFWFVWGPWGGAQAFGLTLELQLLSFFLTPFVVLAGLALVTLAQHLFVLMLAPRRRGLAATGRVLCYANGIGLLCGVMPPVLTPTGMMTGMPGALYLVSYVALLVAVQVWYVIVVTLGMREAHRVSTGRAAAIVLLPMAAALFLAGTLVFVLITLAALAELPL